MSAISCGTWLALGHHLQVGGHDPTDIAVLNQQAASNRAHHDTGLTRIRQAIGQQQAQVLLLCEHRQRRLIGAQAR